MNFPCSDKTGRRIFGASIVRLLFFVLSAALLPIAAFADGQPVVTLEPGYGTTDDTFQLEVTVSGKNAGQLSPPQFEDSEKFEITSIGTSTRKEFINGEQSYQISYAFQVSAKEQLKPGDYTLPKGSMEIDGVAVSLHPGKLTIVPGNTSPPAPGSGVGGGASGGGAERKNAGLDFTQVADNEEPYVGEQILYRAEIASSLALARANLGDVEFNGFLHESFGKDEERRRAVGNTVIYSVREALFPTKPGETEIPPRSLSVDARVPRARPQQQPQWSMLDEIFPDIDAFGEFQTVTRRLTAPAIKLHVKDLPPPPKPGLSYIPVGEVKVDTQFDARQVKQGDSLSLTIEVSGDANLKAFQLPEPSAGDIKDFTVYADQPQLVQSVVRDRLFFKKTFHIALIPQRSGKLALPTYEIVTFDPKQKEYNIQHTSGGSIDVIPGKTNESLVAKGLASTESGGANKEAVQVLGEDLRPIHIGTELSETESAALPDFVIRALLLLPPLLTGLLAVWLERKRRLSADPLRTRQSAALRTARSALQQAGEGASAASALQILRAYLGDRLRLSGESLTSADSEERLRRAGLPAPLCERITTLLAELQRAVYGGPSSTGNETMQRFRGEIEKIFSEVERHAKN